MEDCLGQPVRDYLHDTLPDPPKAEFLCYVMGPYSTKNIDYYLEEGASVDDSDQDLGAFDPSCNMHTVLESIAGSIREHYGANAFIATDADVPLSDEAPNGVDALTQSVHYAKAADATAFVLPYGGIRDGVNIEIGTVLENRIAPEDIKDNPDRFHIFKEKNVSSTTLSDVEKRYDVKITKFDSQINLGMYIGNFINNLPMNCNN